MIKTLGDNTAKAAQNPVFTMTSGQNDRTSGSIPVWNAKGSFAENLAQSDKVQSASEEFGFSDIVDIVNPLQHIPLVSNLYQSTTGDTMGAVARIVGGAIFGGPIGALVSAGTVAYEYAQDEVSKKGDQQISILEGTTVALADLRTGYTPYNS